MDAIVLVREVVTALKSPLALLIAAEPLALAASAVNVGAVAGGAPRSPPRP